MLSRALVFTRDYKRVFSLRKSVVGFIVSDNKVCLADISREPDIRFLQDSIGKSYSSLYIIL